VINDKGELVAVVEGHHTEARLVSLYIAVEEVSAYMEELKDLIDPQTADAFYNRGDRRYFEGNFDRQPPTIRPVCGWTAAAWMHSSVEVGANSAWETIKRH
jgi:hypothetical protein